MKASIRKKVLERDQYCYHCGEFNDLVIHHRRNRGMGGSKLLDRYECLLAVCPLYNGLMESDAGVAGAARGWGHKLGSWEDFDKPVFDSVKFIWYVLDSNGGKKEINVEGYI